MKKITFLALFAVIVTSYWQNYEDLIKKADSCYEAKNYKLSTSFFEKAFSFLNFWLLPLFFLFLIEK